MHYNIRFNSENFMRNISLKENEKTQLTRYAHKVAR
jgi:hypothetical protein